MIPEGAPSFIILVLTASMMGLIITASMFLQRYHLLGKPLLSRNDSGAGVLSRFTLFHYNFIIIILYLADQLLGLFKIIYGVSFLDPYIMRIFFIGNAALIVSLVFAIRYYTEQIPTPID